MTAAFPSDSVFFAALSERFRVAWYRGRALLADFGIGRYDEALDARLLRMAGMGEMLEQ